MYLLGKNDKELNTLLYDAIERRDTKEINEIKEEQRQRYLETI
jgi:hypothetical protein